MNYQPSIRDYHGEVGRIEFSAKNSPSTAYREGQNLKFLIGLDRNLAGDEDSVKRLFERLENIQKTTEKEKRKLGIVRF